MGDNLTLFGSMRVLSCCSTAAAFQARLRQIIQFLIATLADKDSGSIVTGGASTTFAAEETIDLYTFQYHQNY